MSVETELQALTTNVTTLVNNVNTQQALINTNKVLWDNAVTDLATLTTEVTISGNVIDSDRPTRTATTVSLALKQDTLLSGNNIRTINGSTLLGSTDLVIAITSVSCVVLQYEDRSNLRLDPTTANLVNDTVKVEGLGTFVWYSTTNEPDDDETCFTSGTLLGQWQLSEPSYDLIQAHALVEKSFRDELNEDEEVRYAAYLTTQGLI
jgi:hypothetical protein